MSDDYSGPCAVGLVTTRRPPGGFGFLVAVRRTAKEAERRDDRADKAAKRRADAKTKPKPKRPRKKG